MCFRVGLCVSVVKRCLCKCGLCPSSSCLMVNTCSVSTSGLLAQTTHQGRLLWVGRRGQSPPSRYRESSRNCSLSVYVVYFSHSKLYVLNPAFQYYFTGVVVSYFPEMTTRVWQCALHTVRNLIFQYESAQGVVFLNRN